MRANKKLDKCNERCKYSSSGTCSFGLRNNIGCYLNPEVKVIAGNILIDARTHNTKDQIKVLINLNTK